MRFRFMQMGDIPAAVRLYEQMLDERPDEEIHYPQTNEQSVEQFTLSLATQLIGNPNWFCICGVVGSKIREDETGAKNVIGGKVKAFISVALNTRSVGTPRNISFTELLVVDKEFRNHDIARKLVQLMAVESVQRGAQVLEAAWTPGSIGSKIWERLGCVPYRVLGAWITPEGVVRTDMPMMKDETPVRTDIPTVEVTVEPVKRKRGRPPKVKPTEE